MTRDRGERPERESQRLAEPVEPLGPPVECVHRDQLVDVALLEAEPLLRDAMSGMKVVSGPLGREFKATHERLAMVERARNYGR